MTFTNDRSVWQHIFPGFILVAIEPDVLNNFLTNLNNSFKAWVERNKYALAILFMATIVSILVLMYIKGGI